MLLMTPILVIGINRSGSKWLSNLLCNHPDVAGVQNERGGGIMESNMFGPLRSKFDLKYPDDYIALVEVWSRTRFFEITQVDKQVFYCLQPRPTDSYRLFEILLEHYARRSNCAYWLQKMSPLEALGALEHFNDARIVLIKRSLMDTMRSQVQQHVNHGKSKNLLRTSYAFVLQEKILRKIRKRHHVIGVEYERLVQDTDAELRRMCKEIGLEYLPPMSKVRFRSNTSFKPGTDRRAILTRTEETWIRCTAACLRLLPLQILHGILKAWDVIHGPRPIKWKTFDPMQYKLPVH